MTPASSQRWRADPVVVPAEADPLLWAIAFVATIVEIRVVRRVLSRAGLDTARATA